MVQKDIMAYSLSMKVGSSSKLVSLFGRADSYMTSSLVFVLLIGRIASFHHVVTALPFLFLISRVI